MSDEDFDIDSLAAYLHLMPARVARLAERDKLPGRRISGQWRFSRADIHHWLEERIGSSDAEQLQELEGVLDRALDIDEPARSIASLLPAEAIAIPLEARSRGKVITAMTELAARTGWLWDPEKLAEAVKAREDMHPTALDNGVALLHPRRPMASILGEGFLALGITPGGIPFGGSRGVLTDVFFLMLSMDDDWHLRVLARLSRLIGSEGFLDELRSCASAAQVHETIGRYEAELIS